MVDMSNLVSDGLFSAADCPTDMYDLSTDSADPPRDSEVAHRPEQCLEQ
jgi:hypothetical protein